MKHTPSQKACSAFRGVKNFNSSTLISSRFMLPRVDKRFFV
ncbi:hypothetical protein EMUCRT_0559 [Ehrlichia cf. muris str. EmCRT]|uniref:Uncharacterized protein n=1 Tax=Ehrlichia cf. muris str. EmCRT TaxID=1359167 RepID=A0A0F3NFF1_9RICK|nr:hypothetical protein EMUCRT_0559 [Ehrlichia cf. muris str. EmCRT]